MPKIHRLKDKTDFDHVFQTGTRASSKSFLLIHTKSDQKNPRFGFVVAKKHEKSAVKRNRIKRLFREILRKLAPRIAPQNLDMVFLSNQFSGKKSYQELAEEIEILLAKEKLLE